MFSTPNCLSYGSAVFCREIDPICGKVSAGSAGGSEQKLERQDLWSLVSGLWFLFSGFWPLVSGLWFLVQAANWGQLYWIWAALTRYIYLEEAKRRNKFLLRWLHFILISIFFFVISCLNCFIGCNFTKVKILYLYLSIYKACIE